MSDDIGRRIAAEFVGTFALIFIGAGSIVATVAAGGGQGGAGLITIALAHGLVIGVMVSAVGHVSGGHFNPAVTIGAWVTRKIGGGDALGYLGAQLAGGVAGAAVLRAVMPENVWRGVNLGTPALSGVSTGQAVVIEAVLTFFLLWVIFATAVDPEGSFGKVAGLAIGFTIALTPPLPVASMANVASTGNAATGLTRIAVPAMAAATGSRDGVARSASRRSDQIAASMSATIRGSGWKLRLATTANGRKRYTATPSSAPAAGSPEPIW